MPGHTDATIAALATPAGESGIAVIRVSGPRAISILDKIFSTENRRRLPRFEHRRTYHGYLHDESGVLDEVVCAVARAPESYTGEDTVEISSHGSMFVVQKVLELLSASGARAAGPGEFTRRAFLNGKMDLIQAEAVADLIHARTELQRKVAQEQLAGGLSNRINTLADELLVILGTIEANIDFIESDIDLLDVEGAVASLERHAAALDELLSTASLSRPFREGYRVAIAGPVNAGKSSLFNRLVGEARAIVTDIPGTTRDVLREPLVVDGLLFMLQDTAGLRGASDEIERIGVDRAKSALSDADIVLFVVDASAALPDGVLGVIRELDPKCAVVVRNKIDIARPGAAAPGTAGGPRWVSVSARTGVGLAHLKKTLVECAGRDRVNWVARERVMLNARLIATLAEARDAVGVLKTHLASRVPLELLAVDARDVLRCYETATGRRYTDDLLDTVFSRFCIGK